MSTLSERLRDRVKRMRAGRHKGNAKVETIDSWANEVAELEADRRRLAALVGWLRDRRDFFRETASEGPTSMSTRTALDILVVCAEGIDALLRAHGFGPDGGVAREGDAP